MPASTACVQIPYPTPGDPPDVAADMQRLATRVDTLICAIGGNPLGSLTPWWDNQGAVPNGYLRCTGGTFDPLTYPDLAAYLGSNNVPDLRGKFLRGAGGNFPGNAQTSGWDDAVVAPHTHTVPDHQHGMAHTHTMKNHVHGMDHAHGMKNHTHGGTTIGAGAHNHGSPGWADGTPFLYNGPESGYGLAPGGGIRTAPWAAAGDHQHNFGTGGPSDNVTDGTRVNTDGPNDNTTDGASSASTNFIGGKLTTDGLSGTAVAGTHLNRNLPPFFNVTWLIRATNDVV